MSEQNLGETSVRMNGLWDRSQNLAASKCPLRATAAQKIYNKGLLSLAVSPHIEDMVPNMATGHPIT